MKKYYQLRLFEFASRFLFAFILFPFVLSIFRLGNAPYIQHANEALILFYYAVLALFIPNQIMWIAKTENYNKELTGKLNWIKWLLLIVTSMILISSMLLVEVDFQKAHGSGIEKKLNYYAMVGHKLIPLNISYMLITFLAFYFAKVLQLAEDLKTEQDLTI